MRRKRLIVYIAILAVLVTGVFALSGCVTNDVLKQRIEDALIISEDGYFGYHLLTDDNGEKYATLVRLTTEGADVVRENGKIYIPPYVHGYPLKSVGVLWWRGLASVEYYPLGIPGGMEKKLIMPYTCESIATYEGRILNTSFVTQAILDYNPQTIGEYVIYLFNYEGSLNEDCFLLDELYVGEVLGKLPYDPEREGYEFLGWSRDAEGTQMLTDSDVKEELRIVLFAQWTKK